MQIVKNRFSTFLEKWILQILTQLLREQETEALDFVFVIASLHGMRDDPRWNPIPKELPCMYAAC